MASSSVLEIISSLPIIVQQKPTHRYVAIFANKSSSQLIADFERVKDPEKWFDNWTKRTSVERFRTWWRYLRQGCCYLHFQMRMHRHTKMTKKRAYRSTTWNAHTHTWGWLTESISSHRSTTWSAQTHENDQQKASHHIAPPHEVHRRTRMAIRKQPITLFHHMFFLEQNSDIMSPKSFYFDLNQIRIRTPTESAIEEELQCVSYARVVSGLSPGSRRFLMQGSIMPVRELISPQRHQRSDATHTV